MKRQWSRIGFVVLMAVAFIGVLDGRVAIWSSSKPTMPQSQLLPSAQAAAGGEAESLQSAFIRIGQQVGPAVVSISTEQIEKVKSYYRNRPFFGVTPGEEPFEDFFRQFYGEMPEREQHRFGLGSGVIIDDRGFILTNEHVVADADKITVTLADGREFKDAVVKGKDPRSDLAVIKINAKKLSAATLGDSSSVRAGQWAVALGNPFGLMGVGPSSRLGAEPTLTVGVISALNRQLPRTTRDDRDYSDLIQTDAAINPGNSGGPLLNLQGEIIGINVAILTSSRGFEGIGFAIPVNKAKNILDALISGKKVIYGYLGVQIQDITPDVAEYYHLPQSDAGQVSGVLVYQVVPGGPASKAGMKDGDIIQSFDGQLIQHSRELVDRVSNSKAGQRIPIEILREGKRQVLQIEVGERPLETELASGGAPTAGAWRGLQVAAITPDAAERFNLAPGTGGVLVVEVQEGSPADQAGLRPGDVINEINRTRIDSLNDYTTVIGQAKGNALVRTARGYFVIKAGGE